MTESYRKLETIEELEALYGSPSDAALRKVAPRLTPLYRRWIMASRFCVIATVGAEGCDASPRGDDGPVVEVLDDRTLLMPDWRGNNRLDSLRNIVRDGRIAVMFMVPGDRMVVRVNGRAWLSDDAQLRARFAQRGRQPATVIGIELAEVYAQCPKSLIRSGIWNRDDSAGLPSLGEILAEMTEGDIAARDFDEELPQRMTKTLW
ncbi:pyridoxamine 5'-phosphate oxidase family protein [Aquicoccus sp.]|uniref:pyridoxamine 5'-phosphate oxidase family protein n=1 Tax=Aquicoccus sp. TaxID=2055851 RepID=UPI0035618732